MSTAIEIVRATSEQELLLTKIDRLLDDARENRTKLHATYTEIGLGLLEVKQTKAWSARCHSWDSYVKDCEQRFGKGRSSLYGYTSVAEQLSPHIETKQLVAMGISKSQPLAAYVKSSGKKPSPALLEAALSPEVGVEQFRATLSEARGEKPEGKEKWFDVGAFYCSPEERQEIEKVFELAKIQDEISPDLPETIVRKRIMLAMARECRSSWEPLVKS